MIMVFGDFMIGDFEWGFNKKISWDQPVVRSYL
jgi:bifunctional ADP-heptose synthase (sugar kinase/adenylyltransferase)